MYKTLTTILFLATTHLLSAQSYIDYHQKVYEAEGKIMKKEFAEAVETYSDLFKNYENTFWQDVHNACYAAAKAHDDKKTYRWMCRLVEMGYTLNDFDEAELETSSAWRKLQKKYPKLRKGYLNSLDTDYRNFINELFLQDQENVKKVDYGTPGDSIIRLHAKKLEDSFKKRGFPTFITKKDTMSLKYTIMLQHYFGAMNSHAQSDSSIYFEQYKNAFAWEGELFKALKTGKILPQEYNNVVNYHNDANPSGKIGAWIYFKTETVKPGWFFDVEDPKTVKAYRNKIGLPPLTGKASPIWGTWYCEYPFKQIKKAVAEHGKFSSYMEFINVIGDIEKKAEIFHKKKTHKELAVFSLRSKALIEDTIHDDAQEFFDIPSGLSIEDIFIPQDTIK